MDKLSIKDYDKAYTDLNLALRLCPDDVEIKYEIAILSWKVFGQYESAYYMLLEVI